MTSPYEDGSPDTSGGDTSFEEDSEVILNGDVKPAISFLDEVEEDNEDFLNEASPDSSSTLVPVNRNQCPYCFSQFSLEKNYVEHMWRAHGSRRPFRCDDCGIFLSYRSSLYNHRKIHSDKRPFACTDCSAKFRWNNSLKYHMNRAHQKAMAHISNPEKKIRQKRSIVRTRKASEPPPAVPVTEKVKPPKDNKSSTNKSTNVDKRPAKDNIRAAQNPVTAACNSNQSYSNANSNSSNNQLISLLMSQTPAAQPTEHSACLNQHEINNADNSLTAMAVASTMVEQLRQVVQAMSGASDPLPGDPAHNDVKYTKTSAKNKITNKSVKQEAPANRSSARPSSIEEIVSSLIMSNNANDRDANCTDGLDGQMQWNGEEASHLLSAEVGPQLTEHLSRICTQQEALMRRLDSLEQVMSTRMRKNETLLHALLAAVSASQLHTNSH